MKRRDFLKAVGIVGITPSGELERRPEYILPDLQSFDWNRRIITAYWQEYHWAAQDNVLLWSGIDTDHFGQTSFDGGAHCAHLHTETGCLYWISQRGRIWRIRNNADDTVHVAIRFEFVGIQPVLDTSRSFQPDIKGAMTWHNRIKS